MSVQNRRKYDPDFKRNAVLLSEEPGRTVTEVAESLGVHSDLIYRWRRQMRDRSELAFPGNGKMALTVDQKRIRELEKKLKDTEIERDILKVLFAVHPVRRQTRMNIFSWYSGWLPWLTDRLLQRHSEKNDAAINPNNDRFLVFRVKTKVDRYTMKHYTHLFLVIIMFPLISLVDHDYV